LENASSWPARIAILGIGNELNGDDAAGVLAARALRKELVERGLSWGGSPGIFVGKEGKPELFVVETGPTPESFTGPLRRFHPDWVLLVDAAELHQPPGSVLWVEWDQAQGMSASTHTLPPTLLAWFLMEELGCQVTLVGIQPAHLDLDRGLSPEVAQAVERVVGDIIKSARIF
jgi:hydrogenase 3 maturation protease